MKQTLKRQLKKLPLLKQLHRRYSSWRIRVAAESLFANHELFLQALAEKGDGEIQLQTCDGLRINIRQNVWDARIVKEMFIDKPYVRHLNLPANPIVIDIGGYIGDFSLYAAHYLGAKKVVVFEPTIENYHILVRNITDNGFLDRITAVNKAVSSSHEMALNVDVSENQEIHASAYWYSDADTRMVPSTTLPDILREHELASVDLLKIDCEGGEYDILLSATDEILRCFQHIVFEHHPVEGFEKQLGTAISCLEAAGFSVRLEGPIGYAFRR